MSEEKVLNENDSKHNNIISECCSIAINHVKQLISDNIQLELELEKYKRENKELKIQIANDPNLSPKIISGNFQVKEIKKTTKTKFDIGQTELMLRDVIMAAASHYIKFEVDPDKTEVTATLLLAEVEECG